MDNNASAVEKIKQSVTTLLASGKATHGLARSLRRLVKEIILYENHQVGLASLNQEKTISPSTDRLQIGGGKHTLEGFFNIDIVPPTDLLFDVREGIPLPDESIRFIFSEHFLEHIDYPISVKKVVRECVRILKPGGQMVVGVPDSALMLAKYNQKDESFRQEIMERWYKKRNCLEHFNTYIDLVNYHFRDQDDDEKYTPHLWGYDFEKLDSLLRECGFSKVEPWEFDASIANSDRKWGSFYVVGTK